MVTTAISSNNRMTDNEFFNFCQSPEMRDKRIERTKNGKIIMQEPTGSETGSFNFEVSKEKPNGHFPPNRNLIYVKNLATA